MPVEEIVYSLIEFMQRGGQVMWLIAGLALMMWSLAFERLWYLSKGIHHDFWVLQNEWNKRSDKNSGFAQAIRQAALAKMQQKIELNVPLIKTLVLLCPLLGLLGTVSGMIVVFDVIAFTSMGDVRLMANGISRATIPTLASMVVSISGLFIHAFLRKRAELKKQWVSEHFNGVKNA